jgi:HSP20 family protein
MTIEILKKEGLTMILRRLPSLPTWSTGFRDLEVARRDMERLFDSLSDFTGFRSAGVFPAINVSEDTESVYVRAELPGVKSENLDITMENDTLTIAGERQPAAEDESVSYHRREREWGAFRRSFSLQTRVDSTKVQARYVDGILTVILPKAAEARPKQISIQAGA